MRQADLDDTTSPSRLSYFIAICKRIFWSGAASLGLGLWLVAAAYLFGFADQVIPYYDYPTFALLGYGALTFVLPCLIWIGAQLSPIDWLILTTCIDW